MIADMAVHGFSPMDVERWSLARWRQVGAAFGRAYDVDETEGVPHPTPEEFQAFQKRGPWKPKEERT